jgi:hypothetical protein
VPNIPNLTEWCDVKIEELFNLLSESEKRYLIKYFSDILNHKSSSRNSTKGLLRIQRNVCKNEARTR